MLRDMSTVIWKEIKEIFGQRGRFKGGRIGILVFLAVFGIFLPLQNGPDWIRSPLVMIYWAWIPFLLASTSSPTPSPASASATPSRRCWPAVCPTAPSWPARSAPRSSTPGG